MALSLKTQIWSIFGFCKFWTHGQNPIQLQHQNLSQWQWKEFLNNAFGSFLQSLGIIHHTSCPYTPEQNGVAERKHRHLIETVVTLLHESHLPAPFWVEALATANYLINRMPTPSLSNTSPYECLYTHRPDYTHLRPFVCLVYPWLRPHTQHKLQPLSTPCIFLVYHPNIKGYKCFEPISQKTYVSRHVRFIEEDFPYPWLSSITATSNPLGLIPIFPPSSHGLVPASINPSIIHTPPNPNTLIPSGSPSTHNPPIPPIFNPPH